MEVSGAQLKKWMVNIFKYKLSDAETMVLTKAKGLREKEHKKDEEQLSGMKYTRVKKKTLMSEWRQSTLTDHTLQKNHVINKESVKVLG